jgi:hypothetical protein
MMSDIQKLKFVWSAVSSKNTFNKLKGFTEGNFTKLQDKLHNVQPPCLPYLNAYLHTLVEIDSKHPALLQVMRSCKILLHSCLSVARVHAYVLLTLRRCRRLCRA